MTYSFLQQVQMPNGAQAIQLAGQNIQNLQGLQVLPLSALQQVSELTIITLSVLLNPSL